MLVLKDASKVIDAIKRKHTNETLAKLEDYKRRQLEIAQRLIRSKYINFHPFVHSHLLSIILVSLSYLFLQ